MDNEKVGPLGWLAAIACIAVAALLVVGYIEITHLVTFAENTGVTR